LDLPPRIQVVAEGLEALPFVMAGEEQLRLVFFNLIENAADALVGGNGPSEDRPAIRIEGRVIDPPLGGAPREVEILLADNGPGVSDEQRDNLFDLAFSTKRSPRKLGFGLWWVRTLMARLGGEIRLADYGEPGCAFRIRLPAAPRGLKDDADPSGG
jgi:C4-dicarboxylate-specific signal transduction histidine kinase